MGYKLALVTTYKMRFSYILHAQCELIKRNKKRRAFIFFFSSFLVGHKIVLLICVDKWPRSFFSGASDCSNIGDLVNQN